MIAHVNSALSTRHLNAREQRKRTEALILMVLPNVDAEPITAEDVAYRADRRLQGIRGALNRLAARGAILKERRPGFGPAFRYRLSVVQTTVRAAKPSSANSKMRVR